MPKKSQENGDAVLEELMAIKRLLALSLLRQGASQNEIAVALGASQSKVSRMFPGGISASIRSTRSRGK